MLLAGCSPPDLAAPRSESPPAGAWLTGQSAALEALLIGAEGLRGTPLAREAAALRSAVSGCRQFTARAARPGELAAAIRCGEDAAPALPAVLAARLEEADLVFLLPVPARPEASSSIALLGRVRVAPDGHASLIAEWLGGEAANVDEPPPPWLTWLEPASEPPGPPRLSGRDGLAHLRWRPAGGLGLARLFDSGSQADRLFGLKSRLFGDAVLAGAVELALYVPEEGAAAPALAVALDVRLASVAARAMDEFVAHLERTWPMRHVEREIAGRPGACFLELRLLPDFAPCYVVTEAALILGWNRRSVERALAPGTAPALPPDGGVVLELARWAEADAALGRALGGPGEAVDFDYAWSRISLERAAPADPPAARDAFVLDLIPALRGALSMRAGTP